MLFELYLLQKKFLVVRNVVRADQLEHIACMYSSLQEIFSWQSLSWLLITSNPGVSSTLLLPAIFPRSGIVKTWHMGSAPGEGASMIQAPQPAKTWSCDIFEKMITLYAFSGDIAHTQINYFKMEMLHEPYDTLQLQISKSIQIWLGMCKSCLCPQSYS